MLTQQVTEGLLVSAVLLLGLSDVTGKQLDKRS